MVGTTLVTPFCLNSIFLAGLLDDYGLSSILTITLSDDFGIRVDSKNSSQPHLC